MSHFQTHDTLETLDAGLGIRVGTLLLLSVHPLLERPAIDDALDQTIPIENLTSRLERCAVFFSPEDNAEPRL
jgi:hypothetical protein